MLAAHAVTKQRAEFSPKFLVMSSYLIGRQNISLMWPTSSTLIDLELKSALWYCLKQPSSVTISLDYIGFDAYSRQGGFYPRPGHLFYNSLSYLEILVFLPEPAVVGRLQVFSRTLLK